MIAPWYTGMPLNVRCSVTWLMLSCGSGSTRVITKFAASAASSWKMSWWAARKLVAAWATSVTWVGTGNCGVMATTRVTPASLSCIVTGPPDIRWSRSNALSRSLAGASPSSTAVAHAVNDNVETVSS